MKGNLFVSEFNSIVQNYDLKYLNLEGRYEVTTILIIIDNDDAIILIC